MSRPLHLVCLCSLLTLFLAGCSGTSAPFSAASSRDRRSPRATSDDIARTGDKAAGPARAAGHKPFWKGNDAPGKPSIAVRLAEQRAYFYKGDVLVGVTRISSGRKGHETPVGTFKVIEKDPTHRSNTYGDYVDPLTQQVVKANVEAGKDPQPPGSVFLGAPMPHFLRITGDGVGMHAGRLPGFPASHGCIRLPAAMAENFFANAPLSTPVTVSP